MVPQIMDGALRPPSPLNELGYLARVTRRDGRAIEEAIAGGVTLLDRGAQLDGAVIEASYAYDEPPLLRRLASDGVPRIIDSQSLRFVGSSYLETETLRRLPYAPSSPITALEFDDAAAMAFTRGALVFAQARGTDLFLTPALPLYDHEFGRWSGHNERILSAASALNGGRDLDRKPLIAMVAPGPKALADPARVLDRLKDYPIDGIYVQALRLNPVTDSLEKLARLVQFLAAAREAGFPVIVGRVGAFGLVLQALGVPLFDSGLGMAEAHDLAGLIRPLSASEKTRRAENGGGGPSTRVYLEPLKTTVSKRSADGLLTNDVIRNRFACRLGCCRFRSLEDLPTRARRHFLFVRRAEVDRMRALSISAMRLHEAETQLRAARDLAAVAHRVIPDAGLPDFGHLERWLGLLGREQELALTA